MRHLASLMALSALACGSANAETLRVESRILERTVEMIDGREVIQLSPPARVAPGDTVLIEIHYANEGVASATDVVISNPVPPDLVFLEVRAGEDAIYSVDGGAEYGALADLRVKDASDATRPATASDVTHVRWINSEPLPPGTARAVGFLARLP